MCTEEEKERIHAVEIYESGQSVTEICAALGHSRKWLYKWIARYKTGIEDWFIDKPSTPNFCPRRTPKEIEKIVKITRLSLYNAGVFCGAEAIRWQLEDDGEPYIPSVSTIKRILKRCCLTNKRTGRYEPKGKAYPKLPAVRPNDVHQYDFVGPCYLEGPVKFYSLNTLDVITRRCGIEPVTNKSNLVRMVWNIWNRLGIPKFAQVDNEMTFFGSWRYPRGMGQFIRLCCFYGVQAVFIPIREPWRNGMVEKFNDHWNSKFYNRVHMSDVKNLQIESREFETRHNSRYHYSPLSGRTPVQAMESSGVKPVFPAKLSERKFSKPQQGKYHVVRFIRSDGILDIFGERFLMPAEAIYEYVTATIDITEQRLILTMCGKTIGNLEYRIR